MTATAGPIITDETRSVAALRPDPKNARRHTAAQIGQIVRSIDEFGYINRIVIRPDGQIIGGHATLQALQQSGRDEAECRVVAGLTEPQYRKLAIALNRLPENSSWNDDVLAEVLGELRDADEDLSVAGFSSGELDKLLAVPESLDVREIETGPVDDEFWVSVRGPLKDQAGALKALQQVMAQFPSVSVELGTINLG